jgi:hypothetical protein
MSLSESFRQNQYGEKLMFGKRVALAVPVRRSIGGAGVVMALWAAGAVAAMAQTATPSSTLGSAAGVASSNSVAPVANACQRFAAGSVVQQPPALFSQNGVLNVMFSYQTPRPPSSTPSAGKSSVS